MADGQAPDDLGGLVADELARLEDIGAELVADRITALVRAELERQAQQTVCTWCLIEVMYPSALLRITPRDVPPEAFHEIHAAAGRGTLAEKHAAILRAWAEGWPVQINAYSVYPPITTWQGDPVCETHLYGIAQRELTPQTVRRPRYG